MNRLQVEHYLADTSREGDPPPDSFSGVAGGAPCGDLLRISIVVERGEVIQVTSAAEGCAVARAALAALAEAVDGADLLDVARIGEEDVAELLGGLATSQQHAAELAVAALARALSLAASSGRRLVPPVAGQDRLLVALSGGVDSGVAALLASRGGAEMLAVTLKLWQDPLNDGERSCCSPEAVLRARRLAHRLRMPHFTLDLREEFASTVVASFNEGYASGRTPNPCVRCNGEVRIDAMIELADRLGADRLVTGHYARIVDDGEGRLLARPTDREKDQTHMLAALDPDSVERLELPLADLEKSRVREIATEAGLPVAAQPESQDLCFLAGEGKLEFLRRHAGLEDEPGEIVTVDGEVVGTHRGYHRYTVGQRRGLGLGGGTPMYVLGVEATSNRVVIGPRASLERTEMVLSDYRVYRELASVDSVRLRSHQDPIPCVAVAHSEPGVLRLSLGGPAVGVAPGQSATLYSEGSVVGQGTIEETAVTQEPDGAEFVAS
ncbi:MAG: tRNA 2-thiouridine(34) synthase MnmA [bacterium]